MDQVELAALDHSGTGVLLNLDETLINGSEMPRDPQRTSSA